MRYLKSRFNTKYGILGDVTDMTYKDGSPLQVGDLVDFKFSKSTHSNVFVIECATNKYGVMGIVDTDFKLGISCHNDTVTLVNKFYDIEVGHVDEYGVSMIQHNPKKTIIIDGTEIEISIESFNSLKKQLTGGC